MSDKKQKTEENLWNKVLSESRSANKFQNSTLIVLGDKNGGKRTLLNSLLELSETEIPAKKNEGNKLGLKGIASVLEFCYLNVKNLNDLDADTMAQVAVYMVDDLYQKDVLDIVLNEELVKKMVLMIVMDFAEPWKFEKNLNEWLDIFTSKLTQMNISLKTQDETRNKIFEYIVNYAEPQFDEEGKLLKKIKTEKIEDIENLRKQVVQLPEGVLKVNYGIPIIIVINKSDLIENMEKDKDGEKKIEYIIYTLRNLCIMYGATLLFTSSKSNINVDILYEYLLHRLYSFDLRFKSELVHKESIFIPSGQDNQNLINTMYSSIDQAQSYEVLIKEPQSKKGVFKDEIPFEDYQLFLQKLKDKNATQLDNKPTLNSLTLDSKIDGGKDGPGSPKVNAAPPSNSETLKSFYNNLITNPHTPTANAKAPSLGANLGVKASNFDASKLKEKAEKDIMEKMGKFNLNINKEPKGSKKLNEADSDKIFDLIKKKEKK